VRRFERSLVLMNPDHSLANAREEKLLSACTVTFCERRPRPDAHSTARNAESCRAMQLPKNTFDLR